jgi:restriction endonuclease S subunit
MKNDWIEVMLGVVCDFKGGGTPSKSNPDFWAGEIPWASIKDIKGDYLTKTKDFITEEGLSKSASNLVLENEIILATRINPGKAIISKIRTAINQDLKIAKPLIPFSDKFLFYIFKSIEPKVLKVSSGTTVLGVNLTNLKEIKVPIIPLPEQRAIVSRIEELFSELDHAIANLKSAQAKLEIYRQAVLKKAFEGIKSWTISEVGEIAKVKGGKRLPKGHTYSENITEYPYLRVIDFGNQSIIGDSLKYLNEDTQKLISRYTISSEDVYISIAGTIGRVGSIPERLSGSNLTENAAKITEIYGVDSRYLVWFLNSIYAQDQIREKTISTTQPKLALYRIEKVTIKFPPEIIDQRNIVQEIESRLSVADKLAETIETNLKKSESLRQSILKKAFEGKLLTEAELNACRKEADWEPAEKLLERIKGKKKNM